MNTTTRLSLALAVTTAVVVAVVVYQESSRGQPVPDFSTFPAPKYANSPLIGKWEEIARIPCDGGPEYEPFNPIQDIEFWETGNFRLMMIPLDTLYNYSGSFEVDDARKTLRMSPLEGTYPDDIDGEGRYEFDEITRQLVLRDMWLARYWASNPKEEVPRGCGHRLVRMRIGGETLLPLSRSMDLDDEKRLEALLSGRKDSSRRPRDDGSYETMENCSQPSQGSSYGKYWYSERSTVTAAGSRTAVRANFVYIVTRKEDELSVTFYDPTHPEKWLGSCGPDVRSNLLAYPERGRERCKLSLGREGDYEHQVWTGASQPGECASEFAGDAYMITAMRLDADSVEIWERGFDEQGNQTWGSEAPTHYEPATAAWP